MTVEAADLDLPGPYDGLRELSTEVMHLVMRRMAQNNAWRKVVPIRGAAPGVFDDIANFLRIIQILGRPWEYFDWLKWRVFDPALGWVRDHLFNPLRNTLTSLKDAILGWWQGAISWILGHLTGLKDAILGWWHGAIEGLKGHLTWLKDSFIGWWSGAWESLKSHLTWLKDSFIGWWHGAWESLKGHLTWLKDSLLSWWQGAIERIRSTIDTLRDFLHNPLEAIRQLWQRFQETWAGQLLSSIVSALSSVLNSIISAIRQAWSWIHEHVREAADRVIAFARPHVERWVGAFQELPATFLNYVASTAGSDLALQPSRALAVAGSLYALSIAAGSAAMITATALNFIPATNWVGASQFSAFIAEAAGFEPLTRATYGVLLNDVLTQPLRYHWNMQLRPRIPTEGTIFLMGRKRGLNRGEFTQAMGYQGIPDWWIDKEYLFFWTDPSPYWLLRMSEHANPVIEPSSLFLPWLEEWLPGWRSDPWAWYKMKLMLAGFEDTDIPAFIAGFQARKIATAVTQVKTSVRAMLREAYWDRARAEDALRPLGVRQDELELLYVAEELDYQKHYLDDQAMYFKESFRKGELDEQDLTLALSTIYVKPERVYQEVSRERVRALPKPKPITEPKENPRVTSLRTQAINSWTKAYRNWEIDEEDLLLGLTIVTQDRDLAKQLVAVEKTRYRPPPPPPEPVPEPPEVASLRRQATNSWIKRYRAWEIDAEELLNGLIIVLQDPDLARQMVEVEMTAVRPAPPVPPPPPEPEEVARSRRAAINSWVDRFRKEEISARELEIGLGPLIDDVTIIDEVVRLEQLRAAIPAPEEAPPVEAPEVAQARRQAIASWITAFRNGEIDKDELELYLQPFIPDEEIRGQVVALEQLRYVPTPELIPPVSEEEEIAKVRQEAVRGHIEFFQKRLIGIEQLYSYLLADGLVEAVARDTVITQASKRLKVPSLESPYFLQDIIRDLIDQGLETFEEMFLDEEIDIDQYVAWLTGMNVDGDVITYLADTLTLRKFLEGL